jgi:hypothetical protein
MPEDLRKIVDYLQEISRVDGRSATDQYPLIGQPEAHPMTMKRSNAMIPELFEHGSCSKEDHG